MACGVQGGGGGGHGMRVSSRSIMQQNLRKTFLCQWIVTRWAKQRPNLQVSSSKIKLSISHPANYTLQPANYNPHPYAPQNSQTRLVLSRIDFTSIVSTYCRYLVAFFLDTSQGFDKKTATDSLEVTKNTGMVQSFTQKCSAGSFVDRTL